MSFHSPVESERERERQRESETEREGQRKREREGERGGESCLSFVHNKDVSLNVTGS